MKITIVPAGIELGGAESPNLRTATVSFDVLSDLGALRFEVAIIPTADDQAIGLDEALRLARQSLAEFGRALAEEAAVDAPLAVYSPKQT